MKKWQIILIIIAVIFVFNKDKPLFATLNVVNLNDDIIDISTEAVGAQAGFGSQSVSLSDSILGIDSGYQELKGDVSISVSGGTYTNQNTGGSVNLYAVGSSSNILVESANMICNKCNTELINNIQYSLKIQFFPSNDLIRIYHNDIFFKDIPFIDDSFKITANAESHVDGNRGTGRANIKLSNIQRIKRIISEQDLLQLKLTLEDKIDELNSLNLSIQDKASFIKSLTLESEEQAKIINQLKLTIDEQAQLILLLTQESEEQAFIIKELELNIKEKAQLVDKLAITNEQQASLINSMRLSFSDQSEIINALNLTITEDKSLISNLELSLSEQIELVSNLKISNEEKSNLIKELETKIVSSDQPTQEKTSYSSIIIIVLILIAGLISFKLLKND